MNDFKSVIVLGSCAMTIVKITKSHPLETVFRSIYKNMILKSAVRIFKNRKTEIKFWTIPSDPICREILTSGFYEKELLEGMVSLVKNARGVVLDVGANIGNHSLYFSRHFDHVISFEPAQNNCWIFKANVRLNKIRNITLIEKALGNKDSVMSVNDDPDNTNHNLREADFGDPENLVDVRIGDDLLDRLNLTSPVVLIKIDVEGFEPEVVKGLSETIKRDKPLIFWEAFSMEKAQETIDVLTVLGYNNFYHLTKNKFLSKRINSLYNSFSRSSHLFDIRENRKLDGMNVGSVQSLI
jgi:FkbM family methyltransferase